MQNQVAVTLISFYTPFMLINHKTPKSSVLGQSTRKDDPLGSPYVATHELRPRPRQIKDEVTPNITG